MPYRESANRNASMQFVIHKQQLFKRIHPEKSGDESVPFIIELLQDMIRSLIKVSCTKTSSELQDIIRQLEDDRPAKTRPIEEEGTHRKYFRCGKVGYFKKKCPMLENKARPFQAGAACYQECGLPLKPVPIYRDKWLQNSGIGQITLDSLSAPPSHQH